MKNFYLLVWALFLEIFFVVLFCRPITAINVDLGEHLLMGQTIFINHFIPKVNFLSYTNLSFPYIGVSWLSEIFFYLLVAIGNFNLLLLVSTLVIMAAFAAQIYYAFKHYSIASILLVVPLYILLLSFRSDVRPEIFSMLFMSLFMIILYFSRGHPDKKLYSLFFIELLWANMHIYFFVGPLLVLLFLIDDFIVCKFHFCLTTRLYSLTLLGTIIATVINPNGIKGALFPFTVLQNYGLPVQENQSIFMLYVFFGQLIILLPALVAVVLFGILIIGRKNTNLIDWLLAAVFSFGMLVIFRNVLLFVFATFVLFIKQLDYLLQKYCPQIRQVFYPSRNILYLYILCLFFLITIQVGALGLAGSVILDYGKGAGDFILKNNINGPIYNDQSMGGYLAYRLYPQHVYVDNRPEAFPKSFFEDIYIPMQTHPEIFEAENQKYHFNVIVVSHWDKTAVSNKLLSYFVNDSKFNLVYLDAYTVVLLRRTTENENIIAKYSITRNKLAINLLNDPEILTHYLFFFEKVGWSDKETEVLSRLKLLDKEMKTIAQYPEPNRSRQIWLK